VQGEESYRDYTSQSKSLKGQVGCSCRAQHGLEGPAVTCDNPPAGTARSRDASSNAHEASTKKAVNHGSVDTKRQDASTVGHWSHDVQETKGVAAPPSRLGQTPFGGVEETQLLLSLPSHPCRRRGGACYDLHHYSCCPCSWHLVGRPRGVTWPSASWTWHQRHPEPHGAEPRHQTSRFGDGIRNKCRATQCERTCSKTSSALLEACLSASSSLPEKAPKVLDKALNWPEGPSSMRSSGDTITTTDERRNVRRSTVCR